MQGQGIDTEKIQQRIRFCDYLTVAQIFLQDNFFLDRPLTPDDIKPRLLGHWGTCHGINAAYANLAAHFGKAASGVGNSIFDPREGAPMQANLPTSSSPQHGIDSQSASFLSGSKMELPVDTSPAFHFILGPGHGFPALQANLFLDGNLATYDPRATRDRQGIAYISQQFSWPYGFPSHSSPATPTVIAEGGELGYALATAHGASLGHPEKTIAVLIGDGELETATALASLNLHRLLGNNPQNAPVLPILHLNGYKISAPTISGRASERELLHLFRGFGYDPIIVNGDNPTEFQQALKDRNPDTFIIMQTPKGATGPVPPEDSHQVPLPAAKTDPTQLATLQTWLESYNFPTTLPLLTENQAGDSTLAPRKSAATGEEPTSNVTLGSREGVPTDKEPAGGSTIAPRKSALVYSESPTILSPQTSSNSLKAQFLSGAMVEPPAPALPNQIDTPGAEHHSPAKTLGLCLRDEMAQNPNFYFFSPDETTSNKLDAVYEASARVWNQPIKPWDKHQSPSGRVLELLSENTLFAVLAGHILSGGQGALASYEAFLPIVSSQLDQHLKFLAQSKQVSWRPKYSALNLLSTSAWQRQDHNGYTHQNPALISTLLSKPSNLANCLFPVDDVAAIAAWEFMIRTKNVVNLTTFNKIDQPRWIDINHARFQLTNGGASIFQFASDPDPDLILTAAGDIPTQQVLEARQIIKQELPHLKIRTIGIAALSYQSIGTTQNKLKQNDFQDYFTPDKPIIANFHGYPDTLRSILTHYTHPTRLTVHGYQDQGSTTTPLDMLTRNHCSRFDLAISAFAQQNRPDLAAKYHQKIQENTAHAKIHGTDLF